MSTDAIERWISEWVVGENLCPFAAAPLAAGRVRLIVSDAKDDDGIYRDFLAEVQYLLKTSADEVETTVLAFAHVLTDFDDYLEMLGVCEQALSDLQLDGVLQIASFHPDYVFAGCEDDDPANFSNRSPLPLFHLLRESSLTTALETVANPERIPERNQDYLRRLGLQEIKRRLSVL